MFKLASKSAEKPSWRDEWPTSWLLEKLVVVSGQVERAWMEAVHVLHSSPWWVLWLLEKQGWGKSSCHGWGGAARRYEVLLVGWLRGTEG